MSIRMKLSAAPFAHLLGLGARAEDDDESRKAKRAEDEKDDDEKSHRAEEDDDGDEGEDKGKKSKKAKKAEDDEAEDDEKSHRAEEDKEGDDEDDKSKRGKKAKKAEDDEEDDDDDEMKGNSASAKARRRERARCAAIFASPAAAGIPHVAASLAFSTTMSRKEAITVLQSVAAGQPQPIMAITRSSLAERMARDPAPRVGLDGGKATPAGMSPVAAAIVAAGEKARGGK